MFITNRERYVEPEYDDEGQLVYSPPPLDELWLTKPNRCERNERLRDQCLHNDEIRQIRAKEATASSPNTSELSHHLPDLHLISDDDSSVEDDSKSIQGGDPEAEGGDSGNHHDVPGSNEASEGARPPRRKRKK